jgi:hypothetical protein
MFRIVLSSFRRPLVLVFAAFVYGMPAVSAQAQTFGAGAGDNPTSDTSRTPFKIKMSGFLNSKPDEGSTEVQLGISSYKETYQFALIDVEAVDNPQVSRSAILQQVGKYSVDFDLVGARDLLSKIGQAEPGTPLTIVGFFQQRNRRLQLESVSIIGMTD